MWMFERRVATTCSATRARRFRQQRCPPGFYAPTINMIAVAFENTNTSNIVAFMMILFPGVGGSFILPDPEVYEDLLLWRPK